MKIGLCIILLPLLVSCGISIEGNRYAQLTPQFSPLDFFDGNVKGWGIVQDRSGNVIQQFVVDIVGTREDDQVTLDETFHYSLGDGVKKRRWLIEPIDGQNAFSGKAGDILGEADGDVSGNALNWQYQMDLPVDDTSYKVKFDDWMWLFDENRLINRSYIKKFGFVMAEVTIFMERLEK